MLQLMILKEIPLEEISFENEAFRISEELDSGFGPGLIASSRAAESRHPPGSKSRKWQLSADSAVFTL